jgi:UDP-glucuronate decarboxylase
MNEIQEDAKYLLNCIDLSVFDNKKVLVTGASGLIGTNLMAFFDTAIKSGKIRCQVTGISKSESTPKFLSNDSIRTLSLNLAFFPRFDELGEFDFVFHGATYGQPGKFIKDHRETLLLNSNVVLNLLERVKQDGKFIFMSSSEIYSGSKKIPHIESDIGNLTPEDQRSGYYFGKLFGETAVLKCSGEFYSKVIRISLCYGPGTKRDDQRVLNEFIRRGILEGRISLKDSGLARRVYCYSRDIIEMILNITCSGKEQIYNVGGNSKITIRELAHQVANNLGVDVIIPTNDSRGLKAPSAVEINTDRYFSEFNSPNFVKLETGIKRTIEWQKRNLYTKEEF